MTTRTLGVLLAILPYCPAFGVSSSDGKPNIIVIFTDDQGYADLGCQGVVDDIRTPHLDRLAEDGVRCTAGYITAPQCTPSRAGLLTGRYQQRFGVGHIGQGPLPLEEVTIADRLRQAGYRTGMVGKWHLDPNPSCAAWVQKNKSRLVKPPGKPWQFPDPVRLPYLPGGRGFDDYFCGNLTDRPYRASFGLDGRSLADEGQWITPGGYRLDVQTEAALAFLRRNQDHPFFLYLAYYAPHVPLEAPAKYLDRFPGPMSERRRHALAMLSAIDDGVGRIVTYLRENDLEKKTLIFFTSDNGAPLRLNKPDTRPVNISSPDWDGSLNDPLAGEKGMLSEGGIRVPFLVSWKGTLPSGSVYEKPVSSLDIAATAVAVAGLPSDENLDGVNLIPYLTGKRADQPHEKLYWAFWNQRAIRKGDWKYIRAGARRYLFDLSRDEQEKANRIEDQLELARELEADLNHWLEVVRLPSATPLNDSERAWFEFHLPLPSSQRRGSL